MTTTRLTPLFALALLWLVFACSKPEPVPAALAGAWAGMEALAQAGDCAWSGEVSVPVSATWEVTASTVKATINRQYNQLVVPVTMHGTLVGNKLTLTERRYGVCNGLPRAYDSRYEGQLTGADLVLVTLDTVCAVERCIFKKTITLTRP